MGLELDKLQNNDDVLVICDNTTGSISKNWNDLI